MFIGDLNDPKFNREGRDPDGNIPRGISPTFPPPHKHYNRQFFDWLTARGLKSTEPVFGYWVAVVTKAQIRDFITFCYDSDPSYTDPDRMLRDMEGRPHLVERLIVLREFVETLDEHMGYALVAEEW